MFKFYYLQNQESQKAGPKRKQRRLSLDSECHRRKIEGGKYHRREVVSLPQIAACLKHLPQIQQRQVRHQRHQPRHRLRQQNRTDWHERLRKVNDSQDDTQRILQDFRSTSTERKSQIKPQKSTKASQCRLKAIISSKR